MYKDLNTHILHLSLARTRLLSKNSSAEQLHDLTPATSRWLLHKS